MEHDKKVLSEKHPGVVFVESPCKSTLSDIEAGRGALWANRQRENVLLKLDDATCRAKKEVEMLMKEHWQRFEARLKKRKNGSENHYDNVADIFEESYNDHRVPATNPLPVPGESLLSADCIHPNDRGYDYYGRHIAFAILNEWDKHNMRSQRIKLTIKPF